MAAAAVTNCPPHTAGPPSISALHDAYLQHCDSFLPPFLSRPPSPSRHAALSRALAFAFLSSSPSRSRHLLVLLHASAASEEDGYAPFAGALLSVVRAAYPVLLPSPRAQLFLAASALIDAAAANAGDLVIALLRRVGLYDHFLAGEMLPVVSAGMEWVLENPVVFTSCVYVYLRLAGEHCRTVGGGNGFEALKKAEIEFCITSLRQHFRLCSRIGRDLVRLLQNLALVPEFKELWRDLIINPEKFGVSVSDMCRIRTPSFYHTLLLTPEMEVELQFLMNHVKFGSQKRYQIWFAQKHLSVYASLPDIVRFICCAHHPTNKVLCSNVIPRWALLGWLLRICRVAHIDANTKLALFFDWLFFNKESNIMDVEPALLLMVNSVANYVETTNSLLEFLLLLVENYNPQKRDVIAGSVRAAFAAVLRKGVVQSLDSLTDSNKVHSQVREKLAILLGSETCRQLL